MDQLPTILGALILAGVLWLLKTTTETQRDVAVLKSNADNHGEELGRVRDRVGVIEKEVAEQRGAENLAIAIAEALDRRGAA